MLEMMADRLIRQLPMRVVRRFGRGMGKAAPPRIVDLIGNHMASGDNRPRKMIIRA
jgi:hypothetical protein